MLCVVVLPSFLFFDQLRVESVNSMSGRLHRRGEYVLTLVLPSVCLRDFFVICFIVQDVGEIHREE